MTIVKLKEGLINKYKAEAKKNKYTQEEITLKINKMFNAIKEASAFLKKENIEEQSLLEWLSNTRSF